MLPGARRRRNDLVHGGRDDGEAKGIGADCRGGPQHRPVEDWWMGTVQIDRSDGGDGGD